MPYLKKVILVIIRQIIKKTNYFNTTLYMKLYTKYLQICGLNIENYCGVGYIDPTVDIDGSDYSIITLGENVTISKNVLFLTHDMSIWTAFTSKNPEFKEKRIRFLKPITIGNNVFIGANTVLLPGTIIEDNVIIGSNSVVKGIYQKNSVYAGNPATKISTLSDFIDKHEKLKDYQIFK